MRGDVSVDFPLMRVDNVCGSACYVVITTPRECICGTDYGGGSGLQQQPRNQDFLQIVMCSGTRLPPAIGFPSRRGSYTTSPQFHRRPGIRAPSLTRCHRRSGLFSKTTYWISFLHQKCASLANRDALIGKDAPRGMTIIGGKSWQNAS